jgi:hypothetical protein
MPSDCYPETTLSVAAGAPTAAVPPDEQDKQHFSEKDLRDRGLTSTIDELLRFANEHACRSVGPESVLTAEQQTYLQVLDVNLYAQCVTYQLPLPNLDNPEPEFWELFGSCKLPYGLVEAHHGTRHARGMQIYPTEQWQHAMRCLRAATQLQLEGGKELEQVGQPANEVPMPDPGSDRTGPVAGSSGPVGASGRDRGHQDGQDPSRVLQHAVNYIHFRGETCHLGYGIEMSEFQIRGNQALKWLAKLLAASNRSLTVGDLRGDPQHKLAADSLLGGELETDSEGIKRIKERLDEIEDLTAATGGSERLQNETVDLLGRLGEAEDFKQLTNHLKTAHHNVATQIRTLLRKLGKDMPQLAAHLKAALKLDFPHFGYYPPAGTPTWNSRTRIAAQRAQLRRAIVFCAWNQ